MEKQQDVQRLVALRNLIEQLELEQLDDRLFRGSSCDIGSRSVFGGQVLGQALMAAARTIEGHRIMHSLHGYFLLAGDKEQPIIYNVEIVRDGGSFSSRRVTAIQHGRTIFHMAVSFQRPEEGLSHQIPMPIVPEPEQWYERKDFKMTLEKPFEVRFADPNEGVVSSPNRTLNGKLWFKTYAKLPDDPLIHQVLLAYFSDYSLLGVALLPHGLCFGMPQLRMMSLDHAIWLHRPFRCDEWLLYAIDTPSGCSSRGFCRGSIFNQQGELIASVAQEGLIRIQHDE